MYVNSVSKSWTRVCIFSFEQSDHGSGSARFKTNILGTDGSTYCYVKRDLQKRDTTTFGAYYGVLTAGAVFAAVQL